MTPRKCMSVSTIDTMFISKQASTFIRWILIALLSSFLASCGSRSQALRSVADVFASTDTPAAATPLNPSIRYLRVSINRRVLLLALGYTDADKYGPVEVWYSAKGEVLRLQNGHVVGLTGTDSEWRQVSLSAMPAWPTAATAAEIASYTRRRDVMPGYRYGVVDRLTLRPIATPVKSNLVVLKAADLRWFAELEASAQLPVSHFALASTREGEVAVYGEQCLSEELCLTWQQWPVKSPL